MFVGLKGLTSLQNFAFGLTISTDSLEVKWQRPEATAPLLLLPNVSAITTLQPYMS